MRSFHRSACRSVLVMMVALIACAPGVGGRDAPQPTPSDTPSVLPTSPPIFRFAVIGDYGSGLPSQFEVAERMCEWRAEHPFEDVFTTGDNIYPDGSEQYFQRRFFAPYDCLLADGARFHASLGNHDYVTRRGGDVIDESAFGMPKRNYVYRSGGVRFVIADSNVLDRAWLNDALKPKPSDRWTVVVFHHPVYSTGPHGSTPGYRPSLPDLFRERGVDLILNGHDHLYMATSALRRIRYIVTGGGGASLYTCGDAWFVAICQSRNHFLYVVAGPERIEVRAIPSVGPPFHRFTTTGR